MMDNEDNSYFNNEEYEDQLYRETYINELNAIADLYPEAKFKLMISLNYLNEVLSVEDMVTIRCKFNCFCYNDKKRKTINIKIYKKNNQGCIRVSDAIQALVDKRFNPGCEHNNFEYFEQDGITDIFDAYFS